MTTAPQVSLTPDRIALRPGTSAEVEVRVHNASQLVEHYTTAIVGLPRDDLYDCEPEVVKLRPGEAGTVRIRISIPDRAGPRAGRYILGVLVRASSQRAASRCEELPLEVLPASTLSMVVQPEVAVGGSSATYTVRVTNDGNTPLALDLGGSDPEGKVAFSFRPRSLRVEAGGSVQAEATVRALAPWTGQELRRSLTLRAVAGPDLTAETPATFVQRPRLASGLLRAAGAAGGVAVLAAATVGGALLIRNTRHDSPAPSGAAASQSPSQPTTGGAPTTTGSMPNASGSSSGPASPGLAKTVDFTRLPSGDPPGDRIISGDLYASGGVTLSTVADQAPRCQDAAALALRTTSLYGSFLTSARPVAADRCNAQPVRIQFTTPVRSVRLTFVGATALSPPPPTTVEQYTMTVELGDGTAEMRTATAQQATTSVVSYDAPAGSTVTAVVFGHTSSDPANKDATAIRKVTFVPAG